MQKDKLDGLINIILLYLFVLIGFLVTILKAKALTEEEIGLLAIILNMSVLINSFISFGMPSAVKKFYSYCKESKNNKTGFIIMSIILPFVLCMFVSFIFSLLRNYVVSLYDNVLIVKYIDYTYFFFTGMMIVSFFSSIFQAEQKSMIGTFIIKPFPRILHAIFLSFYLIFNMSFQLYFFFNILVIIIQVLLITGLFFKKIKLAKPDFKFIKKNLLKDFYKYSFFMLFGGLAGMVTVTLDSLMLGYYIDIGTVGIYSITRTVANVISFIGIGFSRSLDPRIAECWNNKKVDEIRKIYKENVNIQIFIGSFIYIVFIIFARDILGFLGNAYLEGEYALIFVSTGLLINLGTGMCGGIISYSKYYKFDFYVRLILVVIVIVTNIIFIPIFGLNGAAFATVLSMVLFNLLKVFFVRLKFKMSPYTSETLRVLLLFGICLILLVYFRGVLENRGLVFVFVFSFGFALIYFFAGSSIFNIKFPKDLVKFIKRKITRK